MQLSVVVVFFFSIRTELQTKPKIQANRSSIYSRAEAVNRTKLTTNQREERRIEMFENCKKKSKTPSSEQHKTTIKGVRMNRRMQLLFEKRDALKNK